MKKHGFFRSLAVMALMACAAFATSAYEVAVVPVLKAYKAAKRTLVSWILRGLEVVAGKQVLNLNPASIFASAKSFYLRLAKRERPVITAGWRACPST